MKIYPTWIGDTYLSKHKIETTCDTPTLHTFGMDITTAERKLRRAQRKYDAVIHQVDGDSDVVMRDVRPPRPEKRVSMDAVDTPVIVPAPLKVGTFWILVNGFYTPVQLHYA